MPQISNLSFNVSFEPHNPNRVGLTNTTPSLPAGFVGIFKVTQPDGYVRNGDINTPDVTNVVSSCVVTLVPDSAGQLQQGQYIIELIGNAPGYLSTSFIRTFTLQYTAATISLRNDFDVFTPQLAYTDISNYNVSGYTISSGPTRKWDATSATTGTISGTNSSIDIKYNNQYYAENYTIQFEVNVAYVSQAYPWLTITHTRTQSTTVTACIPKSLEDLTQAVEALREESNASCGGDWAKFEKANALYAHLLNMLRLVLIAGQHQDGFFDVYQQLLTYIQNGSVACDSIGQVIPPYDFSDYESSIYDGQSSYCQLVGDGVNTVYRVNHQLGDQCVVVQVYEVATGKQVFCDLAVSTINSIDITFYEPPTLNQYRVVAVAGALGLRGQGFQPGGLTGQILRKKTNADFDTEWADVAVALPLLVPYTGATQSVYLGEHGIEAGFVRLDTTPTGIPATPAVMSWNDTDGTAELRLKGNNVTLQVGQEMVARVVNKTGANLLGSQYKAVRVRKVSEGGAQGQRLAVVLAQANTEFLSTDMLGVVTENIDNNQEGFITTFGAIKNIDTTGALQGEVWADGDILFLSPTVPGGLTKVKPSAPNHLSIVGYVEYAHQNNGKIFVHVQTSWELDELHNVSISNPVANQTLVYNSGTGLWENSKLSLHALSNVFVSSPQAGQALVYTGGGWQNQALPPSGVTSVGLATATSGVTITDTPVTGSGVININIATASASSNGLLSSVDWATFNAKQSAITLTTTGNSGAATFVGSTLNIPNYTLSGLGGVPTTRSLTINGTAYDLSADRTWSVGTVTSVAALTIGTAGADISSTVATGTTTPVITLNVPTASASARGVLTSSDWTAFNSKISGSGTVNYLSKFTAGGTIGSSQVFDNGTFVGIGTNTPSDILHLKGILGGDVYLNIENPAYSNSIKVGNVNGGGHISVSGFNPISFYTNGVDRLRIGADGNIGIGTTIPNARVEILGGDARVSRIVESASIFRGYQIASGSTEFASLKAEASFGELRLTSGAAGIGGFTTMYTTGTERLRISSAGVITVANLAGSGARVVVADASGNLSATTLSSSVTTGSGTTNYITKWTGASTQGDSQIFDNGTSVGIGTASPSAKLQIGNGSGLQQGYISGGGYDLVLGASGGSFLGVASQGITTIFNTSATPLGIGTNGSQPLLLGTGNLERLRITSTGDVGIGTSSPSEKLDVSGFIRTTSGVKVTDGTIDFRLSWASGNVGFFGNISNHPIDFYTNAAQRMRIFANGRIGINTTTDAGYQLDVNGTFRAQGGSALSTSVFSNTGFDGGIDISNTGTLAANRTAQIRITNGTTFFGANDRSYQLINIGESATAAAFAVQYYNGTTFSERLRINSSGNVGIGTASPTNAKLVVEGSSAGTVGAIMSTDVAGTTSFVRMVGDVGSQNLLNWQTGTALRFATSTQAYGTFVERMRIDASGNVGIGTTSPAQKLDVAGNMQITGGGNWLRYDAYGYFGSGSVAGGTTTDVAVRSENSIYFSTGGATEKMRLSTTGELIIGGASDAGDYKLQVSGNIYNTGSAVLATNGTSHIGMGVVPSAWSWPNGVTQFRFGGHIAVADNSFLQLGTNSYYDGSNYVRVNAGYASRYLQNDGGHFWSTAITSTAGSTVTFNEQMRMTRDGELLINTTTDVGDYKLQVAGNIYGSGLAVIGNAIINTNSPFVTGANIYTNGQSLALGTQGANLMSFFTNNTERLRITSGGNVGIGDASPTDLLVVNGRMRVNGTNRITFGNNSGGYAGIGVTGATTGNLTFNTFDGTSDGERLRIFANGRVGINTTTDAGYQLDVNGDVRFQGTLYTRSGTNTGIVMASTSAIRNTGTQYFDYGTGGSGDFYFRGGSGFANVLTLMNGGNVGIGTASPANKLSINGAANALTYFLVDNSQTYLGDNGVIGGGAADGNTALSWFSTKDLYFKEGSSTRMTIKSGGELLINTTTDAGDYKLQVAGNILTNVIYTRNNTDALIFGTNSAVNPYIQGTSGNALVLGTSNNPRIWITSDGNVGVGTTSPTQRLDVSGYVIAGVTDRTLIGQDGTYTGYSTVGFGGVGNGSNRVFGSSSSADGLYLAAATGRGITFRVNGTDIASMFINSLGNVGIGTTSPTSKLDVLDGDISVNTLNTFSFLNTNRNTIPSGAGTSLGGLRYRAYSTGTTYQVGAQILSFSSAAWSSTSSPSYLSFQTTPSGSVTPSERMVIDASGNVGVGIASALYKMHVYNTSGESSLFLESGTTTQAALYLANANNAIFNDNSTTNNLKFFVNSATRMTINSAGELLINTTTDAGDYKLQVSGNALVTAGKLDITTNTAFGLGIQRSGTSVVAGQINNSNGILYYGAESSTGGSLFTGSSAYAAVIGSGAAYPLEFATNNIVRASISSAGVAKINDLAGSGTRMVVADSSGVLSTQAIPSGGGGSSTLSFNRQTASYTIVSGDVGKVVEMNVGTANNATIPTNATASIAVGSQITIAQYGSGQTTIVAAAGVTLRATNNWLKISAQYGAATLVKVATDEWYVVGNLSA